MGMDDLIKLYNPIWKESFRLLKIELEEALAGISIKIEHVGSTAVPGLSASQ